MGPARAGPRSTRSECSRYMRDADRCARLPHGSWPLFATELAASSKCPRGRLGDQGAEPGDDIAYFDYSNSITCSTGWPLLHLGRSSGSGSRLTVAPVLLPRGRRNAAWKPAWAVRARQLQCKVQRDTGIQCRRPVRLSVGQGEWGAHTSMWWADQPVRSVPHALSGSSLKTAAGMHRDDAPMEGIDGSFWLGDLLGDDDDDDMDSLNDSDDESASWVRTHTFHSTRTESPVTFRDTRLTLTRDQLAAIRPILAKAYKTLAPSRPGPEREAYDEAAMQAQTDRMREIMTELEAQWKEVDAQPLVGRAGASGVPELTRQGRQERAPSPPLPTFKEYMVGLKAPKDEQSTTARNDNGESGSMEVAPGTSADGYIKPHGAVAEKEALEDAAHHLAKRRKVEAAVGGGECMAATQHAAMPIKGQAQGAKPIIAVARPAVTTEARELGSEVMDVEDGDSADRRGQLEGPSLPAATGRAQAQRASSPSCKGTESEARDVITGRIGSGPDAAIEPTRIIHDVNTANIDTGDAHSLAPSGPRLQKSVFDAPIELLLNWTEQPSNLRPAQSTADTGPKTSFGSYSALLSRGHEFEATLRQDEAEQEDPERQVSAPSDRGALDVSLASLAFLGLKLARCDSQGKAHAANDSPLLCLVSFETLRERSIMKSLLAYGVETCPVDDLNAHLVISPRTAVVFCPCASLPLERSQIYSHLTSLARAYAQVIGILIGTAAAAEGEAGQVQDTSAVVKAVRELQGGIKRRGVLDQSDQGSIALLYSRPDVAPLGAIITTLARKDAEYYESTMPPQQVQDIMVDRWYLEREFGAVCARSSVAGVFG